MHVFSKVWSLDGSTEQELLPTEVLHCGNMEVCTLYALVTMTLTRFPEM